MRHAWAVLLLACGPAASAVVNGYVPCPQGLFRCGEMAKPPVAGRAPALCTPQELNAWVNLATQWRTKVGRALNDQTMVANALSGLASSYSAYDDKSEYLEETAQAIRDVLIGLYLAPLYAQLEQAPSCIPDDKWLVDDGCRIIGLECFDRAYAEKRVLQLRPLLQELLNELSYRRGWLNQGLPNSIRVGNQWKSCYLFYPRRVPCRIHMDGAIGALIQAQTKILTDLY